MPPCPCSGKNVGVKRTNVERHEMTEYELNNVTRKIDTRLRQCRQLGFLANEQPFRMKRVTV